jgi:hypothetical protein
MSETPWPCDACAHIGEDTLGVRDVGRWGYCAEHLARLYRSFSPSAWVEGGLGLPVGQMRPEYGPLVQDVQCPRCGGGWAGVPFERCPWCIEAIDRQRQWQAEIVLTPPDVDPADARYAGAVEQWARRLARAVKAGIVDERTARRAVKRMDAA